MIIIKNALLPCSFSSLFVFFFLQIRILSYLSPDCDAAYLDLLRIRLLCTFAYLVDIMNLRNKTHEFEWKWKGSLSHSRPWVDPRLDRIWWRDSGFFGIARTRAAAYFQWYFYITPSFKLASYLNVCTGRFASYPVEGMCDMQQVSGLNCLL